LRTFFFVVALLCVFSCFHGIAQTDSVLHCFLKSQVSFLSSDEMQGRATGGAQEHQTNQFLIKTFKANQAKGKVKKFTYIIKLDSIKIQSEMVGFFVNNQKQQTLLIGAHVDHIGFGGPLSKSPGNHAVHNGADDNASGVALMMALAHFMDLKKLPFNLAFVGYTGHEIGTFGAQHLSSHWPKKWKQLMAVVNFDMVGRMDEQEPKIFLSTNRNEWFNLQSNVFSISTEDTTRVNLLDTRHFLAFPCVNISTGIHNDYHRISDDETYINYDGMVTLYRSIAATLEKLP